MFHKSYKSNNNGKKKFKVHAVKQNVKAVLPHSRKFYPFFNRNSNPY